MHAGSRRPAESGNSQNKAGWWTGETKSWETAALVNATLPGMRQQQQNNSKESWHD